MTLGRSPPTLACLRRRGSIPRQPIAIHQSFLFRKHNARNSNAIVKSCPLRNREGLAIVIASLEIVQVAKKSTNAEKAFRVSTVYGLLCDGASRADIVRFAAENWDIKERMAENYIADARVQIEQDCQLSRQQFLAETLAGLRQVRQSAGRRGQHQVVVNAIRLQAELVGLTGKTA